MNTVLGMALALFAALDAPLTEPAPPSPLRGTMWERVQAAHAATLAAKPEEGSLFNSFLTFSAEELLQAMAQGLEETRLYNKKKPEAELKPMLLDIIEICLHGYPLVARTPEDLQVFLEQIEQQKLDPVYREYLITRLVPDLAPPSLFGDYLLQGARENLLLLHSGLGRLAYKPNDPEFVQMAGMESLYRIHLDSWERLMKSVPELSRTLPPDGKPTPDLLSNAVLKKLPDRARKLAERKRKEFQSVAQVLSQHFRPESTTTKALRAKAIDVLKRLRQEAPLENAKAVDAIIAQAEQAIAAVASPHESLTP